MKPNEVESGKSTAVTLSPSQRGTHIPEAFANGGEVLLGTDGLGAALSVGGATIPVTGATKTDVKALEDLLGKNLPRLVTIAARKPRMSSTLRLAIAPRVERQRDSHKEAQKAYDLKDLRGLPVLVPQAGGHQADHDGSDHRHHNRVLVVHGSLVSLAVGPCLSHQNVTVPIGNTGDLIVAGIRDWIAEAFRQAVDELQLFFSTAWRFSAKEQEPQSHLESKSTILPESISELQP